MALRVNALSAPPPQIGWMAPDGGTRAGRSAADAGAGAGAGGAGAGARRRARRWRGRRGSARAVIRGMAEAGLLVPAPVPVAPPFGRRTRICGPVLSAEQAGVAPAPAGGGGGAGVFGHAAGWGDRVGQDGGVSGGGGGVPGGGAAGADSAAGDRAVGAVSAAVRAPVRGGAGACGTRICPRARGGSPGGRWRRARRRWWWARARRCSCRSRIWAWWWWTRSTRPRSSRKTAWCITRGTWRWCARGFRAAPAVLVSATPSLETLANVEAGRYRASALAARHGGASLPDIEAVDLRDTPAATRPLPGAGAGGGGAGDVGARGAGDAVPEPPRLCAADAVPGLRAPAEAARTARRGWWSTARGVSCACHHCGHERADPARLPGVQGGGHAGADRARGWSGSPRRRRRCSPAARRW